MTCSLPQPSLPNSADVVVVGGGVIGSAVALFLAREGVDVVLLDREGLGAGSSGACDGAVALQSKSPGVHMRLAQFSAGVLEELLPTLPLDVEYRRSGSLIAAESESELTGLGPHVESLRAAGLDVRLLDSAGVHEVEPLLSPHVVGGAYCPGDHQLNPLLLNLALARGAAAHGARIIRWTPVTGITVERGRVTGVRTPSGTVVTPRVVNAGGSWGAEVAALVGVEAPIVPRRGQLLVTEACPHLLTNFLFGASYLAAKFGLPSSGPGAAIGLGLVMEQTATGGLLIGGTREYVGFDRRTDYAATRAIAAAAVRMMPALARVNVIHSYAGLRPRTPDGVPILGHVENVEGFIMAAGHEGDGIALAAGTGRLIAELITTGATSFPLEACALSRFGAKHAV